MRDFEEYAAHERLEALRRNAARKLTRQQRAQRRRFYRRTSAVFLVLVLCICSALCGAIAAQAVWTPQEPQREEPMETPVPSESVPPAPSMEPQEDFENAHIEEEIAAYQAAYRAEHKEEIAAKQAAYYAEHKEERAAYQAAYYAEHKEEIAAYRNQPDKRAAYNAYMREYMRDYKKGIRRKEKAVTHHEKEPEGVSL